MLPLLRDLDDNELDDLVDDNDLGDLGDLHDLNENDLGDLGDLGDLDKNDLGGEQLSIIDAIVGGSPPGKFQSCGR